MENAARMEQIVAGLRRRKAPVTAERLRFVPPGNPHSPNAIKQLRHRERLALGKVCLTIECDEAALLEVLAVARQIDRNAEVSRRDLEHAVERLLAAIGREA
jgi:hypothetical protein